MPCSSARVWNDLATESQSSDSESGASSSSSGESKKSGELLTSSKAPEEPNEIPEDVPLTLAWDTDGGK